MMFDADELERLRGVLPADVPMDAYEWDRLGWYTQEAVLAQDPDVRTPLVAAEGPVDFDVSPIDVDEDGFYFVTVLLAGQPLLRVSLSRLLPGVPMRVDDTEHRRD